jgi:hypothetical protein
MKRERWGHKNTNDDFTYVCVWLENQEKKKKRRRYNDTQKPRNSVRVKQKKKMMRRKWESKETECRCVCN